MLHGHRAQVRDDAATLHAEPRRRRRRRLVALEDGPIPRHAKMNVDANVFLVTFAEPCEEVLADGFDCAERLVVDSGSSFRKAAVRRRARELLADEAAAVARRHAVDGVALDHSYRCLEWCRAPGSGSDCQQGEDVGNSSEALSCFCLIAGATTSYVVASVRAVVGEK